jgi:hypothetical protein
LSPRCTDTSIDFRPALRLALQVRCWDLGPLSAAANGGAPPPPLLLQGFDAAVEVLAWHPGGRYLAAADGADCSVW